MRIPLKTGSSNLYRALLRKKPVFLDRMILTPRTSDLDREIINKLNLKSFLIVPLVIQNQSIGLILFTSYARKLHLKMNEIKRIAGFCDQVAGAIRNSFLLEETEKSRNVLSQAKLELEKINDFSKKINASVDLDQILDQIFNYIEDNTPIEAGFLSLVDSKTNELYTYKLSQSTHFFPPEIKRFLYDFRLPLDEKDSVICKVYHRKKPFYLQNMNINIQNKYDKILRDTLGVTSFVIVPLIIQKDVIALTFFTSYTRLMKLKQDQLSFISRFSEQIAGAIYSSHLIQQVDMERKKSDNLLLNILPAKIAEELKETGAIKPVLYDKVTIMFTDFKEFTIKSAKMSPDDLVTELDSIFDQFDHITERNSIEKLKTIGDSYMCAGGLPQKNGTHAVDVCLAALEMQAFMSQVKELKIKTEGNPPWEMRVGIHTGSVVAGVIGKNKFAYDVWGDAVNVASRMEINCDVGMINISQDTYEEIKDFFICDHRGKVEVKSKGKMEMYFLRSIKPELSEAGEGRVPNNKFISMYQAL